MGHLKVLINAKITSQQRKLVF